ncbi:MAG: LPS export ABC transporter permease LptF [Paracoccaceae bacterium]
MSRFDRYLLSQFLATFGFFALVLVAVYWVNRAVGLFDQLIGDGQTALVFVEFSLLTLPNVIRLVLPIAAFAAAVSVTNRLMQESELVVMQATGFSAFRLARPVFVFGGILFVMMLILLHFLVPSSRGEMVERQAEISENVTARYLIPGQFTHPAAGVTLYIREISATGELLDMFLTDDRTPNERVSYTARRALFARGEAGPKLIMFDGMAQTLDQKDQRLAVTRFADFTFDLAGLMTGTIRPGRHMEELSTIELMWPSPAILAETGKTLQVLRLEGHSRFAEPLTAMTVPLIGFAALLLGAFSRFGLWRQIGVAIGLLIVVQATTTVAATLSDDSPSAWVYSYIPAVVGVAMGLATLAWSQRPRRVSRPREVVA